MKKILCPFCGKPSFVSIDNQFFCFSCGMGGDRVSYIRALKKISYEQSAKKLGVQLLHEDGREKEKASVYEALHEAEKFFHANSSLQKQSYFKKRGLKKETIEEFSLGYAEGGKKLYRYLLQRGIDEAAMEKAGLLCTDSETGEKYERFWKRIMFPIHDEEGRTIGFGGRVLGNEKPKYLNSPESVVFDKSHNLYALDIAKNSMEDFFFLCEGYVDVISMHQYGFSNAVASLGTAFTFGQAELLRKYKKNIYLVYDSDEAGQKATERAIPILLKEDFNVKIVSVAPHKDVDEFLVAKGANAFKERIDTAISGVNFLAKRKSAEEIVALLTELIS